MICCCCCCYKSDFVYFYFGCCCCWACVCVLREYWITTLFVDRNDASCFSFGIKWTISKWNCTQRHSQYILGKQRIVFIACGIVIVCEFYFSLSYICRFWVVRLFRNQLTRRAAMDDKHSQMKPSQPKKKQECAWQGTSYHFTFKVIGYNRILCSCVELAKIYISAIDS